MAETVKIGQMKVESIEDVEVGDCRSIPPIFLSSDWLACVHSSVKKIYGLLEHAFISSNRVTVGTSTGENPPLILGKPIQRPEIHQNRTMTDVYDHSSGSSNKNNRLLKCWVW